MIYPSGRAAVFAALGAIPALAVALAMPVYWYAGLLVVAFVVALTLIDMIAAPFPKALDAKIEVPVIAFVGQTVAVAVDTTLGGRARSIEAAVEHDERLTGNARAIVRGRRGFDFVARRRGAASIDALWLRWSGPFGMAWRQRRIAVDRKIAVVPDVRPAREEALRLFRRDTPIGEIAQLDPGAGGEFQALAEFRTGMDRRAIDWKHSARHGKLIAKEFRTERNNDIVFAIDAGRLMCEPVDGIPRIDRAVSAALSAAFVALKLGDKVSLFGFDARPRIASGSVSGLAAFGTFQRLAAELDYSTEETNYTFALTTLSAQLKRRSLVLIFTDFVDPTSAELMLRTIGRIAETHLVLFVLMRDSELEKLTNSEPVSPEDVSRAVIAAEMLRERRIVIARLQRLGVQVLEAPYERLGTELVNAYLSIKRRDLL